MRNRWLLTLLLCPLAMGQTAPQTAPPAAPASPTQNTAPAQPSTVAPPPAASVAPDAPVITVIGLCEGAPASTPASECKTVVTRAEFDRLVELVNPQLAPPMRRQLAEYYARLLLVGREARKMGMENDPRVQEMLRLARMQVLYTSLTRELQRKTEQVPPEEIEKYYREHPGQFQEATLQRIVIPRKRQPETPAASAKQPAPSSAAGDEAAMKGVADRLRARAAAGEDFDKLQKEALAAAGMKETPPPTNLGKVSRGRLPENQQEVFDLKPGQVTSLVTDPQGYYVLYKVLAADRRTLESSKDEIRRTLQAEKFKQAMDAIANSAATQLNESYFGSGERAPAGGEAGKPPAAPDNQPAPNPPAPAPK